MFKVIMSAFLSFTIFSVTAQKFGHFSSEYVVRQMPTYQEAQSEIDILSHAWMEDVRDRYIKIGRLENKLEAEKILLTPDMIEERENEIGSKLKEAIDYQYKIFGPKGLLFLKKKELTKPELDKIFEAVKRVCKKQHLDYLMDKPGIVIR